MFRPSYFTAPLENPSTASHLCPMSHTLNQKLLQEDLKRGRTGVATPNFGQAERPTTAKGVTG